MSYYCRDLLFGPSRISPRRHVRDFRVVQVVTLLNLLWQRFRIENQAVF